MIVTRTTSSRSPAGEQQAFGIGHEGISKSCHTMLVPLASNTRLKRALLTCTHGDVSRDLMRGLIAELQVAQAFFLR